MKVVDPATAYPISQLAIHKFQLAGLPPNPCSHREKVLLRERTSPTIIRTDMTGNYLHHLKVDTI